MASLNRVLLIGNLTRDRSCGISRAARPWRRSPWPSTGYTRPDGEKKEQTSFIRIVVWGRRAEVCGEYLSKGSPVFIEGRLQSRDWETQDGQKRNTVEVIAVTSSS